MNDAVDVEPTSIREVDRLDLVARTAFRAHAALAGPILVLERLASARTDYFFSQSHADAQTAIALRIADPKKTPLTA